jgi:hypothetical protein
MVKLHSGRYLQTQLVRGFRQLLVHYTKCSFFAFERILGNGMFLCLTTKGPVFPESHASLKHPDYSKFPSRPSATTNTSHTSSAQVCVGVQDPN